MTKDYKPAPAVSDKPMKPLFLGVVIGLLLGIGIALGVALWLNKSASPFVEKARQNDALPKIENKLPAKPDATPEDPAKPGKSRFEFYQILPGDKNATGKDAKAARKSDAPAVAKQAGRPEKQPDKPFAASKEYFYLQAGAFQSEADADNLKAKIAFIGLQATVKPVAVPDKGTLYRVRLGPYQSPEEVNRIKSALSDGGIAATIVKASDTLN